MLAQVALRDGRQADVSRHVPPWHQPPVTECLRQLRVELRLAQSGLDELTKMAGESSTCKRICSFRRRTARLAGGKRLDGLTSTRKASMTTCAFFVHGR